MIHLIVSIYEVLCVLNVGDISKQRETVFAFNLFKEKGRYKSRYLIFRRW